MRAFRCLLIPAAASSLILAADLRGQRVFETNHEVVYEDATKHRTTLGTGFNPVLIMSAKVAFIAGRDFAYGEPFDCGSASARNWIALYDPASGRQERIFDRPLRFGGDGGRDFCVYRQMQLSHDGSKLYLVSPVAATAGSLAIVDLPRGSVKYAHGVNCVYIIETGPRRGELICQRRLLRKSADTESPH